MTNAVQASIGSDGRQRHEDDLAGLPVVHVRLFSDRVRVVVEVWDANPRPPVAKHTELDDESGRGLMLVEALCKRWEWQAVAGWTGKVVWAELTHEDGT